MTNEIGTQALSAVVPLARKEPVNAVTAPTTNTDPVTAEPRVAPGQEQETGSPRQKEVLEQRIQDLNNLVQELHRELRFKIDDESGETIVEIIDQQTDEVIRQIPAEEVVKLRQRLADATGAIFRDTA